MKKILFIALLSLAGFYSHATIFNITVANFSFSPNSIPNVLIGDVIKFNWSNGSHTTTCDPVAAPETSLPAGAATWNSQMNSSHTTYSYTVTTAGTYNFVCIPHSPAMAGSFTVSSSLPVILTSFNVTNLSNKALLTWKTSSEENSDYFSVQKSNTGKDYAEIGKVAASGYSSTDKTYSFLDENPTAGSNQFAYYLIAIVDKDGRSNYSSATLYKDKNVDKVKIIQSMTNPVSKSGHLMVNFNADHNGKMDVQLYNIEGKVILQAQLYTHQGVNMGHIPLTDIASGSYTIKFLMEGNMESYVLLVK